MVIRGGDLTVYHAVADPVQIKGIGSRYKA